MAKDESDDPWVTERWAYVGRQLAGSLGNRKIQHVWLDPNGDRLLFDRAPKSAVIGGAYDVEIQRHEAGGITAKIVAAEYKGVHPLEDGVLAEWRLADRGAVAAQERARAVKRQAADNGDFGDLTLREVADMVAKAPTVQRWGLVAADLDYINRG